MTSKQKGNTLLGLIIGALIGLAVALGVAVYITKMPVPFINKSQPHTPETDAAEARKNRDWNPNAPLAGKNPAKSSPSASGELSTVVTPEPPLATVPDSIGEPSTPPERPLASERPPAPERAVRAPRAPAAVTAPAAASTSTGAATAAVSPAVTAPVKPARPAVSADPLGDLAKSRSEAPALASGADPFNYFIQAGAFRTPEDAEQQRAKLLLLGMQARVSEREQAGRTVYRVRVGPFEKKDDADKVKNRLDNNSIETALVRVQR